MHVVKGNPGHMVLDLLGEGVCQPRESPHLPSHSQVLALHKASGNMLRLRIPFNRHGTGLNEIWRTITSLALAPVGAIQLELHSFSPKALQLFGKADPS